MAKKISDIDKLEMTLMQNPEFAHEFQVSKPYAEVIMKIIRARHEAGLTQTDVAKRVGTTQSAIARLESFEYDGIKLETLIGIAEALNLKVDLIKAS